MRFFWLFLYYSFARYLPESHNKLHFFGGRLRNVCARHIFKYCAPSANIERLASFGNGQDVEIGDRSAIGINCHVPSDIKIGDNVMMGPNCFFLDNRTHVFVSTSMPMIDQGTKRIDKRTIIGDDVWIGRQCIILAGKQIGSHSIVGAGSVVSKDIPCFVIAAGNPIRIIREREYGR